ncbi:hypothetical protein JCGZ_06479 [Jatropha curcas]|uniref:Uncharacterized protein n=1 Tax=Jatropha curcas TaxID=180498 RepID=A0A067LDY6_JATCU|nr:hypothetical protein JCGZ_06479 [Jatropha curcas]
MATSKKTTSLLSSTQKYAAGALFAIAVHQAQIHQSQPLGFFTDDNPTEEEQRISSSSSNSSDSVSEDPDLWVHKYSGLLRPVFRFLDVESAAWHGLEETAGSSPAKHHIGPFLRLLSEDGNDANSHSSDQELALSKAVDVMSQTMETNYASSEQKKEKHREYEHECREKLSTSEVQSDSEILTQPLPTTQERSRNVVGVSDADDGSESGVDEKPIEEEKMLSYPRKIIVLYELLSACLADKRDDDKKCMRRRKGYDARHRVALRLLATWLDIKWIKMEAIETMIACSAMAIAKEEESKAEGSQSSRSKWAKWKRGGIIGAAAITGGTLMAITGAAGAGLAGTKMARRTGSVDEFEFKAIGENHNQGRLAVGIMVSGFVFDEGDFVRPWEGQNDILERYVLQWESKNLIAVSTAIQDLLTSSIALGLMKQGAMMTVLSTLVTALAWPATLLAATDFIDSTWPIAIDRSDKAGKLLADVLLKGLQGNRPVTLVGYSLGARVIFKCLETLAETEYGAELVERVVLLGAPISIKNEKWEAARKVIGVPSLEASFAISSRIFFLLHTFINPLQRPQSVYAVFQMVAGRFINAYSRNDWTLGVAFRARYALYGGP